MDITTTCTANPHHPRNDSERKRPWTRALSRPLEMTARKARIIDRKPSLDHGFRGDAEINGRDGRAPRAY